MAGPGTPEQDRRRQTAGWRFLLLGGLLAAAGLPFVLAGEGWGWDGLGVLLMSLGTPPTLVGLGLLLSRFVARRADQPRKDWA